MIKTKKDYQAALARVEVLWDSPVGTTKGNELDELVTRVMAYEQKYYPMLSHDSEKKITAVDTTRNITGKDLGEKLLKSVREMKIEKEAKIKRITSAKK